MSYQPWMTDFFTILGCVISLIFGVAGVAIGYRSKRYSGELTYYQEKMINILGDVVQKDLNVLYKGEKLVQNVFVVSGKIINTGDVDISPVDVDKPITMSVSCDHRWVNAEITAYSKGVSAEAVIDSNGELYFSHKLLRKGEFFSFNALVECESSDTESKFSNGVKSEDINIDFLYRIKGTNSAIKKYKVMNFNRRKKLDALLAVGVLAILVTAALAYFAGNTNRIEWLLDVGGEQEYVSITAQGGKIIIDSKESEYKQLLKVDDFSQVFGKEVRLKGVGYFAWLFIVCMFVYIYFVFKIIRERSEYAKAEKLHHGW